MAGVTNDDPLVEKITIIPALGSVTVAATNVPKSANFLVFQAHSFVYNVSLSYNQTLVPNYHVNGTNIGLIHHMAAGTPKMYLKNLNTTENITVLIVVQVYNKSG